MMWFRLGPVLLLVGAAASAWADPGGVGHHYGWQHQPWWESWFGWLGGSPQAGPRDVPEIDPGMLRTMVTLLAGGVLILTDRRRR